MKSIRMKGKDTEEAIKAALAVLGVEREKVEVKVISEGKPAVMGLIGGAESEVEVTARETPEEEAKQILQNILDKMGFLAVVDSTKDESGSILLEVKGEDMGRIIGKEGAMLKSMETIVSAMAWKILGEKTRVSIDAGGYKEKRNKVIQKLAQDVAEDVVKAGEEKTLPYMEAADRRVIHLHLQNNPDVTTFSRGEGKERRIVIAPKK